MMGRIIVQTPGSSFFLDSLSMVSFSTDGCIQGLLGMIPKAKNVAMHTKAKLLQKLSNSEHIMESSKQEAGAFQGPLFHRRLFVHWRQFCTLFKV